MYEETKFVPYRSWCVDIVIFSTQNEGEGAQLITREYALYCHGRFISQATGEHTFYSKSNLGYGKACESAKSNSLTRCCKDLGIASELWDPQVCVCVCLKMVCFFWCYCSMCRSGRSSMQRRCGVRM